MCIGAYEDPFLHSLLLTTSKILARRLKPLESAQLWLALQFAVRGIDFELVLWASLCLLLPWTLVQKLPLLSEKCCSNLF